MKKIIAFIIITVMISAFVIPVSAADDYIVFETRGLDEIVRTTLNIKTNRKLKESDILKVTELYFDFNITLENLNDIRYFKNLEVLYLENQWLLEDLSGLENCVKLKELVIFQTSITDVSILSKINTIEEFAIVYTPVENIDAVLQQPNLKALLISDTYITDIAKLKNNKTLELFAFNGSTLNNTDVLGNIKSLEMLSLISVKNINANDLKFLTKLKLKEIELVNMDLGNGIVNILKNIQSLEYIDISYNKITRLTPLYDLKNLDILINEEEEIIPETPEDNGIEMILNIVNDILVISTPDILQEYLDEFLIEISELPPELLSGIIAVIITNDYDMSYYDPTEKMLVLNNFDSQNESVIYNENDEIIFNVFDINLVKLILESFLMNNELADILTYDYILEMIEYYKDFTSIYDGFDFLLNYIN